MTTTVRWLSGITMVLVLLQAVLVGQGLYLGEPSRITLHGWIGSVTFVGAIVLAALVIIGVRRGELNRSALGPGLLIALLTVAQIGLGYRAWWWDAPLCTSRMASSSQRCSRHC